MYGHNTVGSLGKKVLRKDLEVDRVFMLRFGSGSVTLTAILNELATTHNVNYVLSLATQLCETNGEINMFLCASYPDELDHFLREIRSPDGLFFYVDSNPIEVIPVPEFILGNATNDAHLMNDKRHVNNLHFNYVPNNSLSPTHNLLNLMERLESNPSLASDIAGISIKLDRKQKILFHYGTLILHKATDKSACLARLGRMGIAASSANYTTFVLLERQIYNVRRLNTNGYDENIFLLRHNAIVNESPRLAFNRDEQVNERANPQHSLISSRQLRQIVRDVAVELGIAAASHSIDASHHHTEPVNFARIQAGQPSIEDRLGRLAYGERRRFDWNRLQGWQHEYRAPHHAVRNREHNRNWIEREERGRRHLGYNSRDRKRKR